MRGLALIFGALVASCGGLVIVDRDSTGEGAGSATSTSTSSTTSTTSTTVAQCTQHADCPGGVCLFASGTCSKDCPQGTCADCGPGLVCNPCGTSSCPGCNDCKSACVPPLSSGYCDDSDPCPPGMACFFPTSTCMTVCTADGQCPNPTVCSGCAIGSCCGCKDCVSLCVAGGLGGP